MLKTTKALRIKSTADNDITRAYNPLRADDNDEDGAVFRASLRQYHAALTRSFSNV